MKQKNLLFLMLMLLCSIGGVTKAMAQTYFKVNGLYYEVKTANTCYWEGVDKQIVSGAITVPSEVEYNGTTYTVICVGDPNGYAVPLAGVTSISLPNTVTQIKNDFFRHADSRDFTTINIPDGVTAIEASTFSGCDKLKSVTFSKTSRLTTIKANAFENCSSLQAISLPDNVVSVTSTAFKGCTGLTSFSTGNGVTNLDMVSLDWRNSLKELVIGNSVTAIKQYAFQDFIKLTSVKIGSSLTTIGNWAFERTGLTSLTIPNNVTSIGSSAFNECKKLKSVTIGSGVTTFGLSAFKNCTALKTLNIGCATIGEDAFYGCTALESLTTSDNVTAIKENAFYECTNLNNLTLGKNLTTIGKYAFYKTGLTSLVIPNSVKTIGDFAFCECNNLTTLTIGSGVTTFGNNAFYILGEVTDITSLITDPTDLGTTVFSKICYSAKLTVPSGTKAKYKAAEGWKNFTNIVDPAEKVKLNKSKATIEKGKTVTLKATVYPTDLADKTVTWKSSNTKVATVSSAGKVKGIKAGTATITCTSNATGKSAKCKVTVAYVTLDKTTAFVKKGKTLTLTPTVYPTTLADQSVTWTSSDTKIATVSSAGKVKGVKVGTATITCTSNATGLSASCTLTVGAVTLSKTTAAIEKGKTVKLKANVYPSALEDKSVTWKSSNTKIATVSSTGKVKGVKVGTATITCTSNATGLSATCKVTVGKVVIGVSEVTIKKSRTVLLEATVYPTTLADQSVTWESSDTKVATVSSTGKVKGVKAGTATITCTSVATGLSSTCTITVLAVSESRSIEGDDDEATGIDEVENASAEVQPYDVYDLSGRKVAHQVTTLEGLPNGIYIVNGKKMLKK